MRFEGREAAARRVYSIPCPRCGTFDATMEFLDSRGQGLFAQEVACASGWIREHPGVTLKEADWTMLRSLTPLSMGEKADRLLIYLAKKYPKPETDMPLYQPDSRQDTSDPEIIAACWAEDYRDVLYLYHVYLYEKGLVTSRLQNNEDLNFIRPAGWDYLHRLRQTNPDSQVGFCAMWFDESVTPAWTDAISPAITDSGYRPMRIMDHQHNNRIDDEIIAKIRMSRFVVADFTHGQDGARGGVYFEVGFALGLGLPVIHTCRADMIADNKIHFDNRQYNFVVWEDGKWPEFKSALQNRINATVGRGKIR